MSAMGQLQLCSTSYSLWDSIAASLRNITDHDGKGKENMVAHELNLNALAQMQHMSLSFISHGQGKS